MKNGTSQAEEKQYQESLINALGEFANHLPDYQKIEIMMFIMSKIPFPLVDTQTPADNMLQSILLKSLLKVSSNFVYNYINKIKSNTPCVCFLFRFLNVCIYTGWY